MAFDERLNEVEITEDIIPLSKISCKSFSQIRGGFYKKPGILYKTPTVLFSIVALCWLNSTNLNDWGL